MISATKSLYVICIIPLFNAKVGNTNQPTDYASNIMIV